MRKLLTKLRGQAHNASVVRIDSADLIEVLDRLTELEIAAVQKPVPPPNRAVKEDDFILDQGPNFCLRPTEQGKCYRERGHTGYCEGQS